MKTTKRINKVTRCEKGNNNRKLDDKLLYIKELEQLTKRAYHFISHINKPIVYSEYMCRFWGYSQESRKAVWNNLIKNKALIRVDTPNKRGYNYLWVGYDLDIILELLDKTTHIQTKNKRKAKLNEGNEGNEEETKELSKIELQKLEEEVFLDS